MDYIADTPAGRDRLARLMNERRRELRIKWTEVARRAGMVPQNLLRIRKGDIKITWDAADGIDDALLWERGGVQAAIQGDEPAIRHRQRDEPEPPPPDLRDETEREIWSMVLVPEDLRWQAILRHREQQRHDAAG